MKNDIMIKSLILLFIFIIGIVLYVCYYRGMFNNSNISTEDEEVVVNKTEEKLSRFVQAASFYSDTGYSSTASAFYNGTTSIDNDIKYKMTMNVIYKIDHNYKSDVILSSEEINSMQRVFSDDISGESVDVVKISDFNKTYEELFHEKPSYSIDTIKNISCPSPWGYNSDLDRLYLFYRCEGNAYSEYDSSITSIEEDDNYYYVHQYGSLKSSIEKSDLTNFKILWKFDKDLNFISTSRE